MSDQERFNAETGEEAAYWFTVKDFADLSLQYGLDKMLLHVLQLRNAEVALQRMVEENERLGLYD